jgi:glycine/D-amino acid oxidase-like deaminating enzyme
VAGLGAPKDVEPLDIDAYDQGLEPALRQRIERPLVRRVPLLTHARYVHGWSSIYTITDDWHPLVGAEPDLEGYYACFAGCGHGFKLAPPLGEALADVIAGEAPAIDIHGFRPSRFVEGETFTSAWGGGNRA